MPPKARRTKPQTEVERELTRIIRRMVREAERDMVRTAHRLAKALAFNIDVKGLAASLHPLPEHVLKQERGAPKNPESKPKNRTIPSTLDSM